MERVEELLREEFRQVGPGSPVSRDEMLARVTRARRQRGAATAGLAAVAVGVAVALVAVTMNRPTRTVVGGGDTGEPRYSGQLINAIFTDANHGYVLQRQCWTVVPTGGLPSGGSTPDLRRECRIGLIATPDGGQNWHERTVPDDVATKDPTGETLDGRSVMFWVDRPGTLAVGGANGRYWTSTDGGESWRESLAPRDTGPDGSLATFGTGDRPAVLAAFPEGSVRFKRPVTAATDGSFWVTCPNAGPCVQVTRDQGQTWHTQLINSRILTTAWVASHDGQTVYVGATDGAEPWLLRSTDGGVAWTRVTVSGLPERITTAAVLPNGDLIMSSGRSNDGAYRLRTGTMTPEKLSGAPRRAALLYVTGGVLVSGTVLVERDEEPVTNSLISISVDGGTTWREVPAPGAA